MAFGETKIAVVGGGPGGLVALKELRDLGYDVTLFERRDDVGGIWSWTGDRSMTTALKETRLCNSKFSLNLSDFPMPADFPLFPAAPDMGSYMKSFAKHYDLYRNVEFGKTIVHFNRGSGKSQWQLTFADAPNDPREFDKVVWATGCFLNPRPIQFEGQDKFAGRILHSQDVRDLAQFKGQNVMVLGMGNTAGDIAINIVNQADKVYLSHRRGAKIFKRSGADGVPADAMLTPTSASILWWIEAKMPWLWGKIMDGAMDDNFKQNWGENKPEWGFVQSPSMKDGQYIVVCNDELIPYVKEGKIVSVPGIKQITGPRRVEMSDGQVIEDIDTIITCTGYYDDMEILSNALTLVDGPRGQAPLPNLYMGIFPPEHADSLALISNVHLNGPQIQGRELAAMSVAQIWAGNSTLPSRSAMDAWVRRHNSWLFKRLEKSPGANRGDVVSVDWQTFVHDSAGTGMLDHIGWGWKAWVLWCRDSQLYRALAHGPSTGYALRLFETGKRAQWAGARQAVVDAYAEMQKIKNGAKGVKGL
ncbi:flavin monooxygenase-like protein [Dactylonectria estremocensis]|uniref:Flavin monooxygenase-like protein n=1 Tax=Dactylonectria estremocensis TaxID=1079267 RepID=A0A9P9JAE5_9HYPO|nr:flavin monooxygenase-like protein [Dactylonectria estremocensis]